MALTRPNFNDILTASSFFTDPMTVMHYGATQANVDVGFLFNRANGLVPNVAIYWNESSQSFMYALTANTGFTDSNIAVSSYANVTVGNLLLVQGSILGVVGNLQLGNLVANTGLYANTASISSNMYVGGNVTLGPAQVLNTSNTITSVGTGATAIDTFANTAISTAKYVISTQDITNSWSQATEILLVQDGANVNIVTYGINYTGPSQRMTFSANISSGTVTLWATGVSTNNTVKLSRTAIPM